MEKFDVVVVGAGIHGAGVAQACAAQGWSTAVVERNEKPALETSCRSSKLVHGGLRYLETAQIKLVHECLRERATLLKNAKDLVRMVPFYIPIYNKGRRHPFWVAIGLSFYNFLAYISGGKKQGVRLGWQTLPQEQWSELGLNSEGIRCVFQYLDAQTDDAILTKRVLSSAQSMGSKLFFNAELSQIKTSPKGFELQLSSGQSLLAKKLVNAAGPWVNQVAALLEGAPNVPLDWVQGTHIILPRPSLSGCIYFEAPQDGRAVFVLPWLGKTMVGTTERVLSEPQAEATEKEQQYLLEAYNFYFPEHPFKVDDIESAFAGIRVLPKGKPGDPPHKRPRETVFAMQNYPQSGTDTGAYIAIYGGKLTSYRATADDVIARLGEAVGFDVDPSKSTRHILI